MTTITDTAIAMSVAEAANAAGISRTTVYSLIKSNELAIVKLGARTLVLRDDLEAYLRSKRVA